MVYNESRELYSLISFLKKVKDPEDEINILVDTLHVSDSVKEVVNHFVDDIVVNERDFDGNFSNQRNYHIERCSGDYIFLIDPDEMPQEKLIINLKQVITNTEADMIVIPRINICPGFTSEWMNKCNFNINQTGWINWPDSQTRVIKNCPNIRYTNQIHEKLSGFEKPVNLGADPSIALWHIKTVDKQENCWDETGNYTSSSNNLYYKLM